MTGEEIHALRNLVLSSMIWTSAIGYIIIAALGFRSIFYIGRTKKRHFVLLGSTMVAYVLFCTLRAIQ